MFEDTQKIDSGLLEHARLGLNRIHSISQPRELEKDVLNHFDNQKTFDAVTEKKQKTKETSSEKSKKKVEYISTKKPVEKSIFYQHSKQGMKYWFEEKKSKPYSSKVPMGRKGTLLGLVDAPLK